VNSLPDSAVDSIGLRMSAGGTLGWVVGQPLYIGVTAVPAIILLVILGLFGALLVSGIPLAEVPARIREAISGLVAQHGRFVCALMPGYLDEELFELAERMTARVAEATGERPAAGAGRAAAAGRVRESWHEAHFALEAREMTVAAQSARNGNGNGARGHDAIAPGVATYRDLGSFQLLLSLQDSEALRLFCDSLLGPIEHGEGHYGGELMRSLEAFIECNGQWESAARRLYCHRHTLRYRIRKIEELTGRDLSSARDRIEFWLALRGREIVQPVHREVVS